MAFDDLGKGLAAESEPKRMTPERLAKMRASALRLWGELPLRDVAAHIDALTADLERVTRVGDGEVHECCLDLLMIGEPAGSRATAMRAADLLSRLSSALASAERVTHQALEEATHARNAAVVAEAKLQRQADVYERPNEGWVCYHCGERFVTPGSARLHFGTRPNTETACKLLGADYDLIKRLRSAEDEVQSLFNLKTVAEANLREARALALEEAAVLCETLTGSDATPTLRPGARMCLHRIRAIKLKE